IYIIVVMMFFGLFGWKAKVRRLRKRWDRLREKALKKEGLAKKSILERLDQTENKLRILEEQKISRLDRARLRKELEIDLEEIKELVRSKDVILQQPPYRSNRGSVRTN
ncbi:MAG: hypothetical protein HY518_02175, partial [Candidatus Aenigmarchaeota archaeon]|nr:hypothetical protein [Candidatus Aenigmarchaeota archaeon]